MVEKSVADDRLRYDRLARVYDLVDLTEPAYKRSFRPRLFAGLAGRILDAGVGTGHNLPFYPPEARVAGVDLSPGMLAEAAASARREGRPVDFAVMDVRRLGFADCTFDAVVAAFVMCVLDESSQGPALAEFARVAKPGGEVRILDYSMPRHPLARLAVKALSPWQRLVFGASYERRPERYLPEAGLQPLCEVPLLGNYVRLIVGRKP